MSLRNTIETNKRPSEQALPVIDDDEEEVVEESETTETKNIGMKPPAKYSFLEKAAAKSESKDTKKSSSIEAFKNRLDALKKSTPKPIVEESTPNLEEVPSITKTQGARPLNVHLTQKNAKATVKLNAPTPAKKNFPYLIMAAEYDSDTVYLWDMDSARIQLRYSGDIDIEIDGHALSKKDIDGHSGYVFFKKTKSHIDKLDELFDNEWRKELKEPLPEIEERNPDLLWEGEINGKHAELYDYTDKSIALFTDEDFSQFVSAKLWMSNRYTHPTRGKVPAYCIGKRGKGIDEVRKLVPINFGMKYTKSPPISTIPIEGSAGPMMIDQRNIELEDVVYEMTVYDYTKESFAVFFSPDIEFNEKGLMRNENLSINGKKIPGYTFSKSNQTIKDLMDELAPGIILEVSKPTVIEDPTLVASIPAVKEENIEDIILKLLGKLSKVPDNKITKIETKGKLVMYGNIAKLEDEIENLGDSYSPRFQGQISETCGFFVLASNDK